MDRGTIIHTVKGYKQELITVKHFTEIILKLIDPEDFYAVYIDDTHMAR